MGIKIISTKNNNSTVYINGVTYKGKGSASVVNNGFKEEVTFSEGLISITKNGKEVFSDGTVVKHSSSYFGYLLPIICIGIIVGAYFYL